MELSGQLSTFSLADVLQWLSEDRRSGALVVRRSDREKRLYFRQGRLIACLSDDPGEYYGEDLLLHGDLSEQQLCPLAPLRGFGLGCCTLRRGRCGPRRR